MNKQEYDQIYVEAFRAGWQEAIKTLQNLEPPALTAPGVNTSVVDSMGGTFTMTPTTVTANIDPNIKNLTDHTLVV